MSIREWITGKKNEKQAEADVEKQIAGWQENEAIESAERKALHEAMGAEKATAEQIYNLRKELGEEETEAERRAQVEVMGAEKATLQQSEHLKPVAEEPEEIELGEEDIEEIELDEKDVEEVQENQDQRKAA
jgi:hypothetical protein